MRFKNSITILIFTLFISLVGVQNVNAQVEEKCLIDVCVDEIRKYDSNEMFDLFESKGEKVFDAWQVLYRADPDINRMKVSLLEEIEEYLSFTGKSVDDVVEEIKNVELGYEAWKLKNINNPQSTTILSVDELLASVNYSTSKKKSLERDLALSNELTEKLSNNPDMLEAWNLFYDINVSDKLRTDVSNLWAMTAYIKNIEKQNFSFSVESFNRFVKDKIDKDAYVESILFPTKKYGGIKIREELLSEVPLVTAKVSSPQYSGASKFGAYEIRIQNERIEYLTVDDNSKSVWKPLNGEQLDDVNFVFTNDGRLKIGHGHYNLSGESRTVISAGKLVIKNGKVTEVSNFSGHYQPSIDNLNKISEVFKELKVADENFRVFERPYSRKTESD
ncbi:hypothetical protein [Aquimarina algicola]|uniref:Uncharacterized protein n=1 Tax=Aquimarina algicola TaxID=2589995 RepID=A0A504JFG1_9FLAO|nr:hypothetical protein [Aquimarina algicola]TPN85250.1 hypothetical protein FHK87_14590 [Aquimarina algicola]